MSSFELIQTEKITPVEAEQLTVQREVLYKELTEMPAVKEAFSLLEKLPTHLRYHTKEHTDDVIKETILFALADGISRGTIEQQVIAAAWHDIGYLEQDKGNEPIAIRLFKESETSKILEPEIQEEIVSNITDTTVTFQGGTPKQKNEHSALSYVLDADLSNFGRTDFREQMEKIKLETNPELAMRDETLDEKKRRYEFVIKLLENHTWHTEGAHMLREKQKTINLENLKEEYASLFADTEQEERYKIAA